MMLTLPPDISLHVFAYLSLQDLVRVQLVSRHIHSFVATNEQSIYHQAAIYHRFVQPRTLLEDAVCRGGPWLAGTGDWKEYCRRSFTVECNWEGKGHVYEGGHLPSEDTLVSFVVDEQQNTAISLSRKDGLTIRDITDNRLLWALSKDYVRTARFDFSDGFLVFMAKQSGLEIWRRSTDTRADSFPMFSRGRVAITPVQSPSPHAVRDSQLQASTSAPVHEKSDRGIYVPHAYLDTSNDIGVVRLFRVNFPLLAYIGFNTPQIVTVVDVATGESIWRVSIGAGRVLGMPPHFSFPHVGDFVAMTMDLTKEHLCVCMYTIVVIFRLPKCCTSEDAGKAEGNPPDMLVLGDLDAAAARRTHACLMTPAVPGRTEPRLRPTLPLPPLPIVATSLGRDIFEKFNINPPSAASLEANMTALIPMVGLRAQPGFVCARFSPDGQHIVAATAFGLVYFAWDFKRVENGIMFSDIAEYLFVDEPLRDICWDTHLRRLAVRTAWEDVFIITLNSSYHALSSSHSKFANSDTETTLTIKHDAAAMRLRDFSNHDLLGWARGQGVPFNGMQMTRTTLWLVWDVGLLAQAVGRRELEREGQARREDNENVLRMGSLCFVDFTVGV